MISQIHPRLTDEWDDEKYYDILDDWELIESSFLMQYGIRLRNDNDMSWQEFCSLLAGIMPKTPLGSVVSVRAEQDWNVISKFTPQQQKIRNDWLSRHGNGGLMLTRMQGMFRDMCR